VLSLPPELEWFLLLLEDGGLPGRLVDRPSIAYSNTTDPRGDGLYDHARRAVPRLRDASERRLARVLVTWGATRWKQGRRGWSLPPLTELRAKWDLKYGPRQWPGGADAAWQSASDSKEAIDA